nr:hypothetical protein [uncultured Desulfobulbus sp.]
MSSESNLNEILKRSAELENVLAEFIHIDFFKPSERCTASKIMCSVAFEHAQSVKMLLATHNFTSAVGLLRLQFEAFVRALWLYYAAKDTLVTKLTVELTHENAKRAQKIPLLSEMLRQLEGKAPKIAFEQLIEFKEYQWKPLSSFVHGGIHAINRHSTGYPIPRASARKS